MHVLKPDTTTPSNPPSPCERAWRVALDRAASQPPPWNMYELFKAWARDIDRRGMGDYHELQRVAADRLGI